MVGRWAVRLSVIVACCSFCVSLRVSPTSSSVRAAGRSRCLGRGAAAVAGVGEELRSSVFDNINVFSLLKQLGRMGSSASVGWSHVRFLEALQLENLVCVALYVTLLDPALRALHLARGRLIEQRKKNPPFFDKKRTVAALKPFGETLLGTLRPSLKLLGWVLALLYAIDVSYVLGAQIGITGAGTARLPSIVATVAYTIVGGLALGAMKNRAIETLFRAKKGPADDRKALAKAALSSIEDRATYFVVQRGSGIAVWIVAALVCFELLGLNVGVTLGSIFSFAGVSGIALGFATKDLVSNWVGGMLLFLTSPFVPGDKIQMSNLNKSVVERIGWYQTEVRGDDDQYQTVPNSQFISNKVSNLSKKTHRQLKSTFFLCYKDLHNAEAISKALRVELAKIPGVDTKRRFYVYMKALRETDLEYEVEVHFRGLNGGAFRDGRQSALLAIARVVKSFDAEFAIRKGLLGEASKE